MLSTDDSYDHDGHFQVSARVNSELTKRAEQFGLILDDISITHLTFGREFTAAVELKQVAQQEAEKARWQDFISNNKASVA